MDNLTTGSLYAPRKKTDQAILALVIVAQLLSLLAGFYFYPRWYNISSLGAASVISCLLCGFSQGLLQLIVHRQYSGANILKYYCWGVINGIWTKWWTDRLFETVASRVLRIFCDQLIGNPTNILLFVSFMIYWDGHDADKYFRQIYIKTLKTSLLIWPIVSTIQFFWLDPKYLVPFNSIINVFWTFILGILSG
jgi:hypothetical protein